VKPANIEIARKILAEKMLADGVYQALYTPATDAKIVLKDSAGTSHAVVIARTAAAKLIGPEIAQQIQALDAKLKALGVEI